MDQKNKKNVTVHEQKFFEQTEKNRSRLQANSGGLRWDYSWSAVAVGCVKTDQIKTAESDQSVDNP